MVRGKSKPNLERGKSCQPMSCLCPSRQELEDWSDEGQQSWWGLRLCSTYECLTSMWALNSWPAPQALTQQPPTPCRVQGAPSQEPRQRGCLPPSRGYCHRGCWTEKPRITMMKWPPALRRGTHEEKNSDIETAQIPVHCRCHKTSNIMLDSCSPMGKHGTQTRHKKGEWILQDSSRVTATLEQGPAHLC